ncbi:agmatine/peptidylarginine deiminase [Gracilimonas sp.]|uniref:agmatine deiminase family protein n=1 Tax=Gracilimonas sp. TaxID=1974203 RepID=UPI002870BEF8|nr:agmatine deiminase family protein [Gracilimonas sp.]
MTKTYTVPAEWSRHSATQLHWPSNNEKWTIESLEKVEEIYCNIIEEFHFYEPVHLFVDNLEIRNRVMQKLSTKAVDLDRVIIHQEKVNDIWARDSGPFFVKSKEGFLVFGIANSNVPHYVAQKFGLSMINPEMELEGGKIDSNGVGCLLTTKSTFPDLVKNHKQDQLKKHTGADQIIWLKSGLLGGETKQYVDNVARWINRTTVLALVTSDKSDENYELLQQNLEILREVTLSDGTPLRIETLPLTKFKLNETENDSTNYILASYCNFYIANGVVLVPLYRKENDEKALELFKKYFPGRKIIGIDCRGLLRRRGSIHAITQPWYGL